MSKQIQLLLINYFPESFNFFNEEAKCITFKFHKSEEYLINEDIIFKILNDISEINIVEWTKNTERESYFSTQLNFYFNLRDVIFPNENDFHEIKSYTLNAIKVFWLSRREKGGFIKNNIYATTVTEIAYGYFIKNNYYKSLLIK